MDRVTDVHQKALSINLNKGQYGTIAEIGAGQETARQFFRIGGAAGTIAKAISAYDMKFSDSIYGASRRYVSRERLAAMLDHEYRLIIELLNETRGSESTFFAFANTVTSRSFSRNKDGHGWLGIRFQDAPGRAPSEIHVHVHLTSKQSVQDQETLGALGVNLIYGALNHASDPNVLLESLMDKLSTAVLEIDMIDFAGPAFSGIDNRLMALRLVQYGFTEGAMFDCSGSIVQPADVLYKKAVLIERSRFRPPTLLNMNMLDCAYQQFTREHDIAPEDVAVISEMTIHSLMQDESIDVTDFLQRADILCALGKNVLVSNLSEYCRLVNYLTRSTRKPMGIVLGIPTLEKVFNEEYYASLAGGILEAFGKLFSHRVYLYVSPRRDGAAGELVSAENFEPQKHLTHLYAYLFENQFIRPLKGINEDYLGIHSDEILEQIRSNDPAWEKHVPDQVVDIIKQKRLFSYKP